MQKIILFKSKDNKDYSAKTSQGDTIYLLNRFLDDQITFLTKDKIEFYIKWCKDPSSDHIGTGNISFIEKEDDTILIGSELSDQPDWGPFFKLPVDQFIKLLTTWQQLVEKEAQKITITDQDGQITIEGE